MLLNLLWVFLKVVCFLDCRADTLDETFLLLKVDCQILMI